LSGGLPLGVETETADVTGLTILTLYRLGAVAGKMT
jgi:hypothetical protein